MMTDDRNGDSLPCCPVCKAENFSGFYSGCEDYISGELFDVFSCSNCGVCFTNLNPKLVGGYYGDCYYNNKSGKFFGVFEAIFNAFNKRRAHKVYKIFSPESVMDVGCGQAGMLKELGNYNVKTVGVESDSAASWLFTKEGIDVIESSALTGKIEKKEIDFQDLITLWHVIEHLESPAETLFVLRDVISESGHILISCPNIASFQAGLTRSRWFHLDVPRHLVHFDRESLVNILERSGFSCIRVEPGDFYQNIYGCIQSIANVFSFGCDNSLYRLLQGQVSERFSGKVKLFIQLITLPVSVFLGVGLCILEYILNSPGTITVAAVKNRENKRDK